MSGLHVPDVDPDDDLEHAAQVYAAAGWYVGPNLLRGGKHAGTLLGKGWPAKTSRHPEQIRAWFEGRPELGLFLHVGRSGALAFDVDNPSELTPLLREHLAGAPHQSTRSNRPGRGHYLFAVPPGTAYGNSTGGLGSAWGEIRGGNGIIIVSPTPHERAVVGGRYHWLRTGPPPMLPTALAEHLRQREPGQGGLTAATDAEVIAFFDRHRGSVRPGLLRAVLARWHAQVTAGASRHVTAIGCLTWALKEARAGYYPARLAHDELADRFITAMTQPRPTRPGERICGPPLAGAEFAGIAAFAVAEAAAADLAEVRRLAEAAALRPPTRKVSTL